MFDTNPMTAYKTKQSRCRRNVDSLVALAASVVARRIAFDLWFAKFLPQEVKSLLISLLSKRGSLSIPVLRTLANSSIKSIHLDDGNPCYEGHLRSLQVCDRLEVLHVPKASVSKEIILQVLVKFPFLKELNISSVQNVDDEVLQKVSEHCPLLRLVNIGKCNNVSDLGIQSLAQNCSLLAVLDISSTNVTDTGIRYLSEGSCRNILTELYIDGCILLTDKCSEYLSRFQRVKMLSFYNCPQLLETDWFESLREGPLRVKNISFTI